MFFFSLHAVEHLGRGTQAPEKLKSLSMKNRERNFYSGLNAVHKVCFLYAVRRFSSMAVYPSFSKFTRERVERERERKSEREREALRKTPRAERKTNRLNIPNEIGFSLFP